MLYVFREVFRQPSEVKEEEKGVNPCKRAQGLSDVGASAIFFIAS